MAITLRLPTRRIVASHAARAGILAASANVAATFARGLLPRSVGDQAIVTGVCTAAMYQAATTAHAAAETIALFTTGSHGMRGREPDPTRTMVVDLSFATAGMVIDQLFPPKPDENIAISVTRFIGETLMLGGSAGAVITVVDQGLNQLFPKITTSNRPLLADVALGGAVAGLTVYMRHQNAREFGLVDPKRRAIKRAGLMSTLKASGVGLAAAAGLLTLTAGEQALANWIKRALNDKVSRFDIGSPLIGHGTALGLLGIAGGAAFVIAKRRIEEMDDIVEPAYPEPPANPYVTAGPNSEIAFDAIGKEGRRFVLMALSAEAINTVMQEPAKDPIRIVGGYDAASSTEERAQLCLREMEALGAFDRSLICIASPTGVGYVSYCFAESLEYLTRGDCAIVVPQYALVPSAMALFDTKDGVALQRRVLELTRDHIATLPLDARPRLVQFGESLGAQVALDVCASNGPIEFDRLGVQAGLYMGVPFRSPAWLSWRADRKRFDPDQSLQLVSEPSYLIPQIDGKLAAKHVMIVHDDDPVNKFSYALVIRQPWWMGPPTTRPPKVPRETVWRPITTFMLTLMDLFNGMSFKPGEFVRRGHDYRIDSEPATSITYGLPRTAEQAERIETALKQREQDWATRRLVARKFASARDSISRTLKAWGVSSTDFNNDEPLVADINPSAGEIPNRLGSSGVV